MEAQATGWLQAGYRLTTYASVNVAHQLSKDPMKDNSLWYVMNSLLQGNCRNDLGAQPGVARLSSDGIMSGIRIYLM